MVIIGAPFWLEFQGMRIALMVIGILLLVAGIYLAYGHGSYSSTQTLAQVGSHVLKVTEQKSFPRWIGYAGMAVGAVLVLAGLLRGKR